MKEDLSLKKHFNIMKISQPEEWEKMLSKPTTAINNFN